MLRCNVREAELDLADRMLSLAKPRFEIEDSGSERRGARLLPAPQERAGLGGDELNEMLGLLSPRRAIVPASQASDEGGRVGR